ncbi:MULTISPECIES: hypothetical protein [unclassified Brachybacterium]|uniref:hypothetical protein n=1 Tax=unclassified Brachybacterium TaxID=2623841 RepID=UPI000C808D7D|nr:MULTISPECIES: hypothetical protein [unclassified Brachybacterium]PMC74916.1 hypothetical protein CJ197_10505 [Brachybacterium sp. UMB0905]
MPALAVYFEFLEETGRWKNSAESSADLADLVYVMELQVIEVFGGPSRRGMHVNVITYAMEQGVDLTDSDDLEDFLACYNYQLRLDERVALRDTGRLPDGTPPYTPGTFEALGDEIANAGPS